MAKKKSGFLVLILLIAAAVIIYMMIKPTPTPSSFLTVRLYDANGNFIGTTGAVGSPEFYSIINGVSGVSSFTITINVQNTGTAVLSCTPNSIIPAAFDTALTKDTKNVLVGNSIGWTSTQISAAQFEAAPTPDVFSAAVTCTWTGSPITQSGSVSLTIQPDASGASFQVSLSPGGLGTEWCGDTICQANENITSCPIDCTPPASRVRFRTSDLSYVSGSAIAYNDTGACSVVSSLTQYGYVIQGGGNLLGNCLSNMPTQTTYCGTSPKLIMSNLPGGWMTGGEAPSLWKPTEAGIVCVCDSYVSPGTSYNVLKYSTSDTDKTKVSSSISSINSQLEVAC